MNDRAPTIVTMRILWAALLASQAVYLAILLAGVAPPADAPPEPVLITALSVVAMFNALLSILLPRYFVRAALAQPASGMRELVGQPPDVVLRKSLQVSMSPFIIGLALAESVAIFGLILGFLGAPLLTVAPFFAASTMLFLVQFPTEGRFRGPIDEALATQR